MTQKIIFSGIQKSDIVKKYLSDKMTIKKISMEYRISDFPIKKVLKEMGVVSRKATETARKYHVDETYFDNIDSVDKAYFLGLLFADGYNGESFHGGAVSLILVKKDRHILEKFSQCINTNKPIRDAKNNKNESYSDTSRMEIYSKYLSRQLAKLGCMQAKSFKIKFPNYLQENLIRHFIRGYFDGDGCFSYHYSPKKNPFGNVFNAIVNFTSTKDFCLYLKKYFEDHLCIRSYLSCRHPNNHNNNRTLTISGNKQVIKIMQWMYTDIEGTGLYLQRKYYEFTSFCKTREERSIVVSKLRAENGKKVMDGINQKIKNRKENVTTG